MEFKRILIIRTDRIGDVVLSTPTIAATRKAFPDAYIAVMVSPETKDIVVDNPYVNEVIVYDKKNKHKSFLNTLRFGLKLKKKRFDMALVLHSTNRTNIISFIAGIGRRVGYARGKMDFLLTDTLGYAKRLGEKHEAEYSLDLLRYIGIEAEMSLPVMKIKTSDDKSIDALLIGNGLKENEKFIVIHPGASCVSKRWPAENFAKVSDFLNEKFSVRTVLVSSSDQINIGEKVSSFMNTKPVFLCGKTSLGELGALFKRSLLFISNDSGPVHIACSVGAPVISIFGRNEKGLSPMRWGPLGGNSLYLHKEVGCVKCLAHDCERGFLCLNSIKPEEVIDKSFSIIKERLK